MLSFEEKEDLSWAKELLPISILGAQACSDTRLCWQRKKSGKPRPIKMGELLRSAYAKRLVNQHQLTHRSKVLRMHQRGTSLPGACEGLCHWRGTRGTDLDLVNGTFEPHVAADLALVIMSGNALRRTHFLEAAAWTEWQHQADSVTTLPPSPPTGSRAG